MQHILDNFRPDLFAGKHVLVTGGTSGIGLDIALGFDALGARVMAVGSSQEKLTQLARQYPSIQFKKLDVTDHDAIVRFVADLPELSVLVNAAGISRPGDEYDDTTFHQVMSINLSSVMRLSKEAAPLLQRNRGTIINIASMLSYLADPLVPAYCASKSGLLGLTRALAHQLGQQGVRVNAIAPGYHRTAMTRELWNNPEPANKIEQRTALKRWGEADDLVGSALFLASGAASYITGATLAVDGGYVSG